MKKIEKLHELSETIEKIAQMCTFTSVANCIMVLVAGMVDHTLVGSCSEFMVLLMMLPVLVIGLMGIVMCIIDIRIKYLTKKIKA